MDTKSYRDYVDQELCFEQPTGGCFMSATQWPDISFGPVNLYSVMPADMFYMSQGEQWESIWKEDVKNDASMQSSKIIFGNNIPVWMSRVFQNR
jgi:hypothetical protein